MESKHYFGKKGSLNMTLWATSHRYLSLYWLIFSATLKAAMSYRFNFFVQLWYGPAYVAVLFLLLATAYTQVANLGGLNQTEGVLLFATVHFQYMICIITFMKGVRMFLQEGVRLGELDLVLTKPVQAQFLTFFGKPEVYQLLLEIALGTLLVRQIWLLRSDITIVSLAAYAIVAVGGILLTYLSVSLYATSGFFVTRGQQILEFFDKASDSAQYPITIFPSSIQLIAVTLIPTAFMGYVQVQTLLGRVTLSWIVTLLLALLFFWLLQRHFWLQGLKKYSSASS